MSYISGTGYAENSQGNVKFYVHRTSRKFHFSPSELAAVLSGNMCESGIFRVVGQKYAGVRSLSLFLSYQFTNKNYQGKTGNETTRLNIKLEPHSYLQGWHIHGGLHAAHVYSLSSSPDVIYPCSHQFSNKTRDQGLGTRLAIAGSFI